MKKKYIFKIFRKMRVGKWLRGGVGEVDEKKQKRDEMKKGYNKE
jgi:hypothetical protein